MESKYLATQLVSLWFKCDSFDSDSQNLCIWFFNFLQLLSEVYYIYYKVFSGSADLSEYKIKYRANRISGIDSLIYYVLSSSVINMIMLHLSLDIFILQQLWYKPLQVHCTFWVQLWVILLNLEKCEDCKRILALFGFQSINHPVNQNPDTCTCTLFFFVYFSVMHSMPWKDKI